MRWQIHFNTFFSIYAKKMTEHIYRKFPNHIKAIQELLKKDTKFKEICADYEEICTWLAGYCSSEGQASEECFNALELIHNLEDEINKALSETGY